MLRAVAPALVALAIVLAPAGAASDPWTALHRPLHIPRLAPGALCPVTPVRPTSRERAQGRGPVYPIGGFPALPFVYPPDPDQLFFGSAWSGQKVLWRASTGNLGRVLIRGRQLDGAHQLRFGHALAPARELRLEQEGSRPPSGWWSWPTTTRVRAPGCYAWQVDGAGFSRVIVFRAVRVRSG
jgi:hypothetical protein